MSETDVKEPKVKEPKSGELEVIIDRVQAEGVHLSMHEENGQYAGRFIPAHVWDEIANASVDFIRKDMTARLESRVAVIKANKEMTELNAELNAAASAGKATDGIIKKIVAIKQNDGPPKFFYQVKEVALRQLFSKILGVRK